MTTPSTSAETPRDNFSEHDEDLQVRAGIAKKRPWGFCVTKDSKCTDNMCDEYGCHDRKRGGDSLGDMCVTSKPTQP